MELCFGHPGSQRGKLALEGLDLVFDLLHPVGGRGGRTASAPRAAALGSAFSC